MRVLTQHLFHSWRPVFRPLAFYCTLVFVLCALPYPPLEHARASQSTGLIAFTSNRTGNYELFTMDADGTNQRQITNNSLANSFEAALSPDASAILYTSVPKDNSPWQVYRVGIDGSNPLNITNDTGYHKQPSWSPDGSQITYASWNGNWDIYVMNADGSDRRQLTNDPANEDNPAWSPNGALIAYTSEKTGNADIYVMASDGSNQHPLIADAARDEMPAWSPDGNFIAFASNRSGNKDIFIAAANGSDQRNVTQYGGDDFYPAWSPDGNKIAFETSRNGASEVFVISSSGDMATDLSQNPAGDGDPSWASPPLDPALYTISGVISDPQGGALPGVTISDGTRTAVSDNLGIYMIVDVPPGSYILTPQRTGCMFQPTTRPITLTGDMVAQNFTGTCEQSPPLYSISGRITNASGTPLSGTTLTDGTRTAMTDSDGVFQLNDVPAGVYTLVPSLAGCTFQPASRNIVIPPDSTGQQFVATCANGQAIETVWSWEKATLPTQAVSDLRIAIDPSDGTHAFLAGGGALYVTDNAGTSWQSVQLSSLFTVNDIEWRAGNAQRLFVLGNGLLASDDHGQTWSTLTSPGSCSDLLVSAASASRLYAACGDNGQKLLRRSDDEGQTWATVTWPSSDSWLSFAVSSSDPNVVLSYSFDKGWRSTDGGQVWAALPTGTLYNKVFLFLPDSPFALYIGHWTGLLRSTDNGANWQSSEIGREVVSLAAAPEGGHAIFVLAKDGSLNKLSDTSTTWGVSQVTTPDTFIGLSTASGSPKPVLYAWSQRDLYRYIGHEHIVPHRVLLPLISANDVASESTAPAEVALAQANYYRSQIGLTPLKNHPAIITAAENHVRYSVLNRNDPSAQIYGAHGEVEGKPGFTGKWPSDRIQVTGFPWFGGAEDMHGISEPILAVDGWIDTVYHRLPIIDPGSHYTGFGAGESVSVMDFGGGLLDEGVWINGVPHPLVYPFDGQQNVPTTWYGGEWPDPLPPDATRPVGYPISVQGVYGKLNVQMAELQTAAGVVVPVHPSPATCVDFNCYAMIAKTAFQPNTTYKVRIQGTVEGVPFDIAWQFRTGVTQAVLAKQDQ